MLLHLALILFNVSWSQALLTSKDFHRLVAPECFRVGQIEELEDLPRTVKSFVELVSKVEKAHRLEDAAETASLLLRRCLFIYLPFFFIYTYDFGLCFTENTNCHSYVRTYRLRTSD